MTDIAIIGGGAAGLAAAVTAAREGGRVTLYERAKRIGASILASGNGRCNLSNARLDVTCYYNAPFVEQAFSALSPSDVLDFFDDLGLLMREEEDGRLYPLTNRASTVLDVLRFAAEEAGVRIETELAVHAVTPAGQTHLLTFSDGTAAFFDRVIVAVGGDVAQSLLPVDYPFRKTEPRLCPLRTDRAAVKGLDNIRVRCAVSLVAGTGHEGVSAGKTLAIENGEVLFRSFGVSGIAVFNLSRSAAPGDDLLLNLLPDLSAKEAQSLLERRITRYPQRSAECQLAGIAIPAVARAVLREADIDASHALAPSDARAVARFLQAFCLRIEGFDDRTFQVHRGGFDVASFDATTMESQLNAGLFVTGEALDVDGPCGGYNLHWAWASGLLAGRAASR